LDNSLLFEGLNSFAANPDGFNLPNPGILMKANFKDLFEDYEFEGGVRVPTTFNGTEYFLTFKDKKRRLDRSYAVYRRNQRFSGESQSFVPNRREVNILLGQYGVRYPLDIFRSFRATGTLRRDRVTQLATERSTLEVPTTSEERMGLKLEYVFDNTLDVALNLKNGSRYKVYAEVVKKFNIDLANGADFDFARGAMGIVGFDARHYQRFLKHSVIALRAAGATSFGSERMIYFLGGVDNWLFNTFNNDVPIPAAGSDIAFQALATNMRGFELNIRNGSSYLLSNIELRMPIFKYFSKRVRSPFFRNFQLVGFFDVGTAWEGRDPFSEENPLNTDVIDNGPLIDVKVNYFRDPVVAGYGGGVRALLFGYFVRLDYAWGIETRIVQDPIFYLSIGTDF
ncbi:MAG TPA: BamA/TamA family outer membrane protein, partial [Phaeodactylibacter sp.]|nr:BamA/TamA family outer membrane protein [Phaeodactylibacter sp.]